MHYLRLLRFLRRQGTTYYAYSHTNRLRLTIYKNASTHVVVKLRTVYVYNIHPVVS